MSSVNIPYFSAHLLVWQVFRQPTRCDSRKAACQSFNTRGLPARTVPRAAVHRCSPRFPLASSCSDGDLQQQSIGGDEGRASLSSLYAIGATKSVGFYPSGSALFQYLEVDYAG